MTFYVRSISFCGVFVLCFFLRAVPARSQSGLAPPHEVNLRVARMVIEKNKAEIKAGDDFRDFKNFLKTLDSFSYYSIANLEDYTRKFLPKTTKMYSDSCYLYFVATYYRIANHHSDSLYVRFPLTLGKMEQNKPDDDTRALNDFLNLFGLRLLMTEGAFYIDADPKYFSEIFFGKGSPDLDAFLTLRSDEMQEGFSEDAGLTVSFNNVYRRVLRWESFRQKYPNSLMMTDANYFFNVYFSTLLNGLDNSRIFDASGTLIPEVRNLYEAVLRSRSGAASSAIIKGYYSILQRHGFKHTKEADQYLLQKQIKSMQGIQPPLR